MSDIQELLQQKYHTDLAIELAVEFGYKMCEKGENFHHTIIEFRRLQAESAKDKIDRIIKRQFNNYEGRLLEPLKEVHAELRKKLGDELFLFYLVKQERENPKPEFKPSFKTKEFLG